MADFTGMLVSITLKDGFVLEGRVGEVLPGEMSMVLVDAFSPLNGWRSPSWKVRGETIGDLRVVDTSQGFPQAMPASGPGQSQRPQQQGPQPAATELPVRAGSGTGKRQASEFVDPAILSYGRSPAQTRTASKAPQEPSTPIKSVMAKAAEKLPSPRSPFVGEVPESASKASRKPNPLNDGSSVVKETGKSGESKAAAGKRSSQQEPGAQKPTPSGVDGTQDAAHGEGGGKKKTRRTQKKKGLQDPPPVMNVEVSRNGNDMDGNVKRGKGWRQTPFLQPSPQTSSPQGRKSRRQQQEEKEGQKNGWATEEATDIQDLGDFDFEANHKLFDKKQVFDQLRQGDTTADEERLVSHNKSARPGTYGGKNLHPTENVLSPPLAPKYNSNELDSTSDADTELNFAMNGRSSSRHSTTRTALKKQPSRQNSAQIDARPHPLSTSISSERPLSRTAHSLAGRPGRAAPTSPMPMPDRTHSPQSAISTTRSHPTPFPPIQNPEPHLATLPSMTPCPTLHPLALETLEKEAVLRFGLTHDAITETAARHIAETALSMLDPPTSRRGSRANTLKSGPGTETAQPVIVILTGPHLIGARAVAAARHLLTRNVSVILAETRPEEGGEEDAQWKTQSAILKRLLKSGFNIRRAPWPKAQGYIKNLPSAPGLIIDGLLAGQPLPEDVGGEVKEMIHWANRSRAAVLSLACPAGVSGVDGGTVTDEGEPLAIRPEKVLALGCPVVGVLEGLRAGEKWGVEVGDLGIGVALKKGDGVDFGSGWRCGVRFVDGGKMGEA